MFARCAIACVLPFLVSTLHVRSLKPCHVQKDGYNDRVKDAWDQNTEKLFDERRDGIVCYCFPPRLAPTLRCFSKPFPTGTAVHQAEENERERLRRTVSAPEKVSTTGLRVAVVSGGSGALVRAGVGRVSA